MQTLGLGGDEPHYLIITESLLQRRRSEDREQPPAARLPLVLPGELRPDFLQRGQERRDLLDPCAGTAGAAAAGLRGRRLPRRGRVIALLAALTALAIFDLADALAGRRARGADLAGVCLTVPFVPYAWSIFPEMPGALLVAWAALWVWRPTTSARRRSLVAWRGVALALLPWLHTKFVVFLAIFAAALALASACGGRARSSRSRRRSPSPARCGCIRSTPSTARSIRKRRTATTRRIYVLTRNIPHGLLGIFFDQKFGLLFYSPIYLAGDRRRVARAASTRYAIPRR